MIANVICDIGNQYGIKNELDRPARVFFSQGCEPVGEGE